MEDKIATEFDTTMIIRVESGWFVVWKSKFL